MSDADENRRSLARTAVAAFGADPNAQLFVALAEHAPELPFLKADIVRWMLGQAPVPEWVCALLPGIAAEAAESLRRRAAILDGFSDAPATDLGLGDVQAPDWTAGGDIHNWRRWVSDDIRLLWPSFTPVQRTALAREAERLAMGEDYD